MDVDFPDLMRNKCDIVCKTESLMALLSHFAPAPNANGILGSSDAYVAIGCDLRDIDRLKAMLQNHFQLETIDYAIIFIAEVSIAYMDLRTSQNVFTWAASHDDVQFCLLEQHLPDGRDHPFATTMLSHFNKLRTPLHHIGTMEAMKSRFVSAGWPEGEVEIQTLWELWDDPEIISDEERMSLNVVEPFDEWEEFATFASHYFLLIAKRMLDPASAFERFPISLSQLSSQPVSLAGGQPSVRRPTVTTGKSQSTLYVQDIPGDRAPRRFGAAIPATTETRNRHTIALHGGLGTQQRRIDCDTYSSSGGDEQIHGPPLEQGIMCHTATQLGSSDDCMIAGGRTSPDRAFADSWLREDGVWTRVQDLPKARYRHCAMSVNLATADAGVEHTVLLHGGKASSGHVMDDWILWRGKKNGWQVLDVVGDRPNARFGASMITDEDGVSGIFLGGMTASGRFHHDLWRWRLQQNLTISCQDMTREAMETMESNAAVFARFGAQLVRSEDGILLVGGVTESRLLTRQTQILNLKTLQPVEIVNARALLVGSTVVDVPEGVLVLGGGATCFSFGTYWSASYLLARAEAQTEDTKWQSTSGCDGSRPERANLVLQTSGEAGKSPTPTAVPRVRLESPTEFSARVAASTPVILTDLDLGPCTTTWTPEYLKHAVGAERPVVIHASTEPRLNFQQRNFTYETRPFGDFVDAAQSGEPVYLRSIAHDVPHRHPTSLARDFPTLAPDFVLPPALSLLHERPHSSPLRISGRAAVWLHYDVAANVLAAVRGRRELLLFPPADVGRLQIPPGGSSSARDPFTQGAPPGSHPHVATLRPGDALLIPPLWAHAVATPPRGAALPTVAVNVFFRSLPAPAYAAGTDVYANRDLAAYEKGRRDVATVVRSWRGVSGQVAGFYLRRLAAELADAAERREQEAPG